MSQRIQDWADVVYVPQTLGEIIGNESAVSKMKRFVEDGNFPHLLLLGPPGTGKTASARILAREIDSECRLWDTSDNAKLDVIQGDIIGFAKTKSIDKNIKVAILDEIENFSNKGQDSLRGPLVKYSQNCRFILITNEPWKLIEWIKSRCHKIVFRRLTAEEIHSRLCQIASRENLSRVITDDQIYGISSLANGDMRNAIKNLQGLCQGRTTPVRDEEIEECAPEQASKKIGNAIYQAFKGDFSGSIKIVDELLMQGMQPREFYDTVCNLISASNFGDWQKKIMSHAVSRISFADLTSRAQIYGVLAFIVDNRGG